LSAGFGSGSEALVSNVGDVARDGLNRAR